MAFFFTPFLFAFIIPYLKDEQLNKLSSSRNIPINKTKSSLFQLVYDFFNNKKLGISIILTKKPSYLKLTEECQLMILKLLDKPKSLTFGQIYLLLNIAQFSAIESHRNFLNIMIKVISEVWRIAPYNLQLKIMDSIRNASYKTNNDLLKREVINTISELPCNNIIINSFIIDTLSALGTLESEKTEEDYYLQIQELIQNYENKEAQEIAYNIYCIQFDHPTDSEIVYKVIEKVSKKNKGIFLIMAAKGMNKKVSSFGQYILHELCDFKPKEVEKIFLEYCIPPNLIKSSFPQEKMAEFIISAIGLAYINYEFPKYGPQKNDLTLSWWLIAEIYYWINNRNFNDDEKEKNIENLWNHLNALKNGWLVISFILNNPFLLDSLNKLTYKTDKFLGILPKFENNVLYLASKFLTENGLSFPEVEINLIDPIKTAITILEKYGTSEEREVLLSWVNDKKYGQYAVKAIKCIDDRIEF